MQTTTPPYGPLLSKQAAQPAPANRAQVSVPLPPHVLPHAQSAAYDNPSSLAARHIENQTASIDRTGDTTSDTAPCVIAGYRVEKTKIYLPDGEELRGLGRPHADLLRHFNANLGTPFTNEELRLVLGDVPESRLLDTMRYVRHRFNIQPTTNNQGIACWVMNDPTKASSTTVGAEPVSTVNGIARDPAAQYLLQGHHLQEVTVAAREKSESMRIQVGMIVDPAAQQIGKALTDRRWASLNHRIQTLSKDIQKFLDLQDDDHGSTMYSAVSPAVQMVVNAMTSHQDPLTVAHMKAGCHHFGVGRFPLPLMRLLRCMPPKKSTIEVVASHQEALNSPANRTRALQAVLVSLSWLEIPWIDASKGGLDKQSSDIDAEIQRLFNLLYIAYEDAKSDEGARAAIVSNLKEALVPEHCSLSLAIRLKHAKSRSRSLAHTLQASLIQLESAALKHRGPPYGLHPFEAVSPPPGKDAKRKAGGPVEGHVDKKAKASGNLEPTARATPTSDDSSRPSVASGVSVAALPSVASGGEDAMSIVEPPPPSLPQTQPRQPHPNLLFRTSYTSEELLNGDFSTVLAPQWIGVPMLPSNTNMSTTTTNAATKSPAANAMARKQPDLIGSWTDQFDGYDSWW